MKKLIYTLLGVSIIFAACKKEEDEQPNNLSIVGVWTPTSVDQDSSMTTTIAGEVVDELNGEVMTYSGHETLTPEEAGIEGNIEFTTDGKVITDDTSSYIYSNNILTITDDDGTITTLPCTFTATNLTATFEMSMDTAYNEPDLILLGFTNGDITISAYFGQTIHCTRNTVINTNVNQRIGKTNNNWFVKPKLDNIIKSIKK